MDETKKERTWGTITNTVIFWAGVACILPWIWTSDPRWGWTGLALGGAALLFAFGLAVARKMSEQKEAPHG